MVYPLPTVARDLAVLEARIAEGLSFSDAAGRIGVTRQQAEWICRRLHPVHRNKAIAPQGSGFAAAR